MSKAANNSLIACHDCDLLFRARPLRNGERAACPRCGAVLYHQRPQAINRALIYSLTSLIFFGLANIFPFMTFQMQGREQVTFLTSGGFELLQQGFWGLGVLVLSVGVLLPFLRIIGTLYVLIPLEFNIEAWKAKETFKFIEAITPWAMMEVLMLGVIVAYVKLIDITTIVLGASLYSFAALIFFMTLSAAALEPLEVWERLEQRP
ncbi:MAG TPA: paraquat-inducible protein A [Desulfobacterales bacterium]|nr:paraquat-inducible protein A [Desulfobacterales bacterium]